MGQIDKLEINLDEIITSDDMLGKDVIDLNGKIIGITEKVFIDPLSFDFVGVGIDKGFLKKSVSIGKNYISKIAKSGIFLKISLVYEVRGMQVFSKQGEYIGKVSSVKLIGSKNMIKELNVRPLGLFKKNIVINPQLIDKIGYNIILNCTKQTLEAFLKAKP